MSIIREDRPKPSYAFKSRGVAALTLIIILSTVALFTAVGVVFALTQVIRQEQSATNAEQALAVAEAGAEEVSLRIRRGESVPSPLTVPVGSGTATVTNSLLGSIITIISRGDIDGVSRAVELVLQRNTTGIAFNYGVQVGDGGLELENNAQVIGSVYSNGNAIGLNGSNSTGDLFVAGTSAVVADQAWTTFTAAYTFGQTDPQEDLAQQFQISGPNVIDTMKLYLQRVGSPADISYQIVTNNAGNPSATVKQSGTITAASVPTTIGWVTVDLGSSTLYSSRVPYWIVLNASNNASNYYQWGSDTGNGYAGGVGKYSDRCCQGSPTWTAAGRDFDFQIDLGEQAHVIDNFDVGGNAYAPTIQNLSTITGNAEVSGTYDNGSVAGNVHANRIEDCTITGNAEYNTISACTVGGTSMTPTTPPDAPEPLAFPISDQVIQDWKDAADAGGVIVGDCTPGVNCSTTLGPVHITGDLLLTTNNTTLTLTGTVWVSGHVEISNGSRVILDPSYGDLSGALVTDGWIKLDNNGQFGGSGQPGSYVMFLTTISCIGLAEETGCGGNQSAVEIKNGATGAIFYAPSGLIFLHQTIEVTEITGWKFHHSQNSIVRYEQGLANAKFSSGPGGGYTTLSWREILPP